MLLSTVFAESVPWGLRHTTWTVLALYHLSFLHSALCICQGGVFLRPKCCCCTNCMYISTAAPTTTLNVLTSGKTITAQPQGPEGWSGSEPAASADEGDCAGTASSLCQSWYSKLCKSFLLKPAPHLPPKKGTLAVRKSAVQQHIQFSPNTVFLSQLPKELTLKHFLALQHNAFQTSKGHSATQFFTQISFMFSSSQKSNVMRCPSTLMHHNSPGMDKGWWRRKSTFLGVAVVSIFPSLLLPRGKMPGLCAMLDGPPRQRMATSSGFVLWVQAFATCEGDGCIRSSPLPRNEIRALLSVNCSWITNTVGIKIAEAGKEEFIHLAHVLSITTGRALENTFLEVNASRLIISSQW